MTAPGLVQLGIDEIGPALFERGLDAGQRVDNDRGMQLAVL